MKNLKRSEKLLISILLIAVIGYGYLQYILSPQLERLKVVNADFNKYSNELNQLKVITASNKKLAENLNEAQVNYKEYLKVIPNSDRSAEIIRDLKLIGDKNNLILNNLNIASSIEYQSSESNSNTSSNQSNSNGSNSAEASKSAGANNKIMIVPVSMNISGDYTSIMNYVKSIEENTRYTNIKSATIISTATNNLLTASISIEILYMHDGTATANSYDLNNGAYGKINPYK
jgi:Tfp pilus assembly protein PilO